MPSHADLENRVLDLESKNSQLSQEIEWLRASFTKDLDDNTGKSGFNGSQLQQEYTLRSMLDNMPAMIGYLDKNLLNRYCNKAYSSWFGVSPENLLGKHIRELLGEKIFHQNLPYIEAALRGQPQEFERTIPTPDGSGQRYSLAEYIPDIIDGEVKGFFVQVSDISAIKLAESELRIAAIAFKTQEGMFVTDANAVILRVNSAFIEISGYTAEEAVGQTPRLLKSGRHDAAYYAAMWESVGRNGFWQGEIWNQRKSGKIFPQFLTITEVKDEAGKITHYVATMVDITLRRAAEEKIQNLAFYDTLTKLPNRRLLNDRLNQAMAVSKHSGRYGALIFLDLDNFKPLNDLWGHSVGDLLLIEVAERITTSVREADTVARFGGDEFVIILTELDIDKFKSTNMAFIVAEKIRLSISKPFQLTFKDEGAAEILVEHKCTSSIGMTLFIGQAATIDDLLQQADSSMYRAKDAGRNSIHINGNN
jgi:diguanylate cyclase (GGDEF)-like protein/PAS domain S-box-containing protein